MLCLRAKTKVRYATLLCIVATISIYTTVKYPRKNNFENLDYKLKNREIKADFTRRSFTAKWHDGRGLLNEVSETKKNANIRAKFVKHLAERRSFEKPAQHQDRFQDQNENFEIALNGEFGDPEPKKIFNEPKEYRSEDGFDEAVVTTASNYESLLQELDKSYGLNANEAAWTKPIIIQSNENDEHQEIRIKNTVPKKNHRHLEKKDDPEDQGGSKYQNKEYKEIKQKRNGEKGVKKHENQRNLTIKKAKSRKQSRDVIEEMKKSNRTIFEPNDSMISYHTLHEDENFTRSLTDESRLYDSYWAPGFPMTSQDALIKYGDRLPPWEHFEIMHYPKIYYLGLGANKTQLTSNATENFGYDYFIASEEEGHYKVVVGDHIGYRYEILKFLGAGTFGAVVLARDWSQPTARNVALKIMHYDENDKYIVREINMMKLLEKSSTNRNYFSRMLATFDFRNHKCLVLELLGDSMHRRKLGPVKNMAIFRRYAHDILMGLHYLRELNIVHADMKPGNIMYLYGKNNQSDGQLLKIADFGIGCIPGNKEFKCPAYYVQTRYYRAPEVILSLNITPAVDMFSVGVIFSEFFRGTPPFFGETETDHLAAMMEVLGLPPTYMIAKSPRRKVYQKAICYETENGFKRRPYRKPLTKVLSGIDPELFDLIARCLEFDPNLRITPEEALKHPFVTGVKPEEELKTPISMLRFHGKI